MMWKKIISIVLVLVIINLYPLIIMGFSDENYFNAINPTNTQQSSIKSNFNFIQTNINDEVVYTYNEDNEIYKVVENINMDLKRINSKIYKLNEVKTWDLISEIKTNITVLPLNNNNSIIEIKSTTNNKITSVNKFYINRSFLKNQTNTSMLLSSNSKIKTSSVTYEWRYDGITYGSNKIIKYTLSTVIAVLTAIAGAANGDVVTLACAEAINNIAQNIIADNIPTVYWKMKSWTKWLTSGNGLWYTVGSKVEVWYYSDSNRTQQIGYSYDVDE